MIVIHPRCRPHHFHLYREDVNGTCPRPVGKRNRGTPVRTWRCQATATATNSDPPYSGKHHDHGVNIQGLATAEGELLFLGQARPGSVHDLTAARADGIVGAATHADIEVTADSGYQGADGTIRALKRPPGKGHNGWEKRANSALARLRAAVERPVATLKRKGSVDSLNVSVR